MSWSNSNGLILSCRGCDIRSEYMNTSKSSWHGITVSHDGFPAK
ncbi:hypothetical protein ACPOL_3568 [Acidisarcina polymorpha]|uniref:Uncharacterized protein n=1 Tax=Acidisarcina polymorpha TaxID=2211140 RepID=A0A2Z5G115_9BACT|nr:hypothetical protein ACPOL_3568 [Acidisarcina polymorpha]